MALTGYIITVYQDVNPSSPTYNQTRETRDYNDVDCPTPKPANWVADGSYCELTNGGRRTGFIITTYRDIEELSLTYNQVRTERTLNETDCPPDTTSAEWTNIGEPFCRQIQYQPSGYYGNDGYMVQEQMDDNEYSSTYEEIRQVATLDTVHCPLPDTTPTYVIVSETCHTVEIGGNVVFDGTKDVLRVNTNPYSSTWNNNIPETVNVVDDVNCPSTSREPDWEETERYCETNGSFNTGNVIIIYEDVNPLSPTYQETESVTEPDATNCPAGGGGGGGTVNVRWKFINNKTSGENIQSFVINLSNGSTITGGGGISPNGGFREGVLSIPETDKNTSITVSSMVIQPAMSYSYTQQPTPYIWSSSGQGGAAVLTFNILNN